MTNEKHKSISFRRLWGMHFFIILLLSGCAANWGDAVTATRNNPDALSVANVLAEVEPGPWPKHNWWEAFGDPQLDELMMEALSGSPTLRVAEARVRRASAIAGSVAAVRSPQLNLDGTSIYQRFTEKGAVSPSFAGEKRSVNLLTLGLNYDIDLWGKNRAAYKAALGEIRVAEVESAAARLQLTTAIAATYVRLNYIFEQYDVEAAILKQQEQVAELTAKRVEAGIDSAVELNHIKGMSASTKTNMRAQQEQIDLSRNQLAALVGAAPNRGTSIVAPVLLSHKKLALPTDLPSELIGRRPDVVAQMWRIEMMTKRIEEAKAAFYPNVNLVSFAGFDSIGIEHILSPGSRVFGIGPAITLPLFDGGRLRSNLGVREAEFDESIERYNGLIVNAVREVADQVVSWQGIEAQQREEQEAVAGFKEANRLALLRYRQGLADYLTVLATEEALLKERRREVTLNTRKFEISIALTKALGGGYLPDPVSAGPGQKGNL